VQCRSTFSVRGVGVCKWTYHRFDVDPKRWAKDVVADRVYPLARALELGDRALGRAWLYLAGFLLGGLRLALSLVFWGFYLRIVYTWHASFLVNSVAHAAEATPSRTLGRSQSQRLVAGCAGLRRRMDSTDHRHPHSARHERNAAGVEGGPLGSNDQMTGVRMARWREPATIPPLEPDHVDVWLASTRVDSEQMRTLEECLTRDQRRRANRFALDRPPGRSS
jgi:hypothetical protein